MDKRETGRPASGAQAPGDVLEFQHNGPRFNGCFFKVDGGRAGFAVAAQDAHRLGQAGAEDRVARAADVDSVVERQVYNRHAGQVINGHGQAAFLVLNRVPGGGRVRVPSDDARDLHDRNGQRLVGAVAAQRRHEFLHALGVKRGVKGSGVAAALVPQHAGHAAPVFDQPPDHGAVKAFAALVPAPGIPLSH